VHVWRTQDGAGDPSFLDNHCYTNGPKGDQLFSGNCGDWVSLGEKLNSPAFGSDRGAAAPATTSSRRRARRAIRARCGPRRASAASS
jgi:hypothetical protein